MTEPTTPTGKRLLYGFHFPRNEAIVDGEQVSVLIRKAEAEAAKAERIRLRHEHLLWHEAEDIPLGVSWVADNLDCHTCVLLDEPRKEQDHE